MSQHSKASLLVVRYEQQQVVWECATWLPMSCQCLLFEQVQASFRYEYGAHAKPPCLGQQHCKCCRELERALARLARNALPAGARLAPAAPAAGPSPRHVPPLMLPSAGQGQGLLEAPGFEQGFGPGRPSSPGGCPLPREGPTPAPLGAKSGTGRGSDRALALELPRAHQPHSHGAPRRSTVLDGFARGPNVVGDPASTAASVPADAAGSLGFHQGVGQHIWPARVSAERGPWPDATHSLESGGWGVQEVSQHAPPACEVEQAKGRWAESRDQPHGLLYAPRWEQAQSHLGGNIGEGGAGLGGGLGPGPARSPLPAASDGNMRQYAAGRVSEEATRRGQGLADEGSARRPYADERSLADFMRRGQDLEAALLQLHMEREALAAEAAHFHAQARSEGLRDGGLGLGLGLLRLHMGRKAEAARFHAQAFTLNAAAPVTCRKCSMSAASA